MQVERPQIISEEAYQELRLAIFGQEIASLLPEYVAMFNAENGVCFRHFVDTLPENLKIAREHAEGGDKDAIQLMSDAYHDFRDLMEYELAQNDPEAYNTFIEAVSRGDSAQAGTIVDNFYENKDAQHKQIIDDELDAQFI